MKKIQILTIAILLSLTTQAQLFKYGAEAGLNLSDVKTDNFKGSSLSGFNAGVMAELKLPVLLGVQGEIKYSQKGSKIGTDNLVLSYIDVPVVAKFYILKIFNVHVGPQYSYMLSAKNDAGSTNDLFGNHAFSAVVGIGFDIWKIHYSTRYIYGVTDISSEGTGAMRNQYFQFGIGYWFSKDKKK